MEKEELCFCLGDENLYLEQVLVEQDGVPIFFLCKSSEQNYLALFCGNDRYVVTKVSNSDLQKLLHGEIPMRDVILGQEEFWDIVAGEKPQQDIVECLPISELEVEVLPEEGACFEALTKEMQRNLLTPRPPEAICREDFLIRQATSEDAEEIYKVMQTVHSRLVDKSIYVCDSWEDVKAMLAEDGFGVVALDRKQKIVGCLLCKYPGDSQENLGRDVRLPKPELAKVVHAESAVVLEEYRGNSLQSKMLLAAERLIDKEKYRFLLATVSPENPASFKTLEQNGFQHIVTKEKYGGLLRRIYRKII